MQKDGKRIAWIDVLRVTACFLVVLAHCCDPAVAIFDINNPGFVQGCAIGSAVRCSVPLFVMMTAVLLFPVKENYAAFCRKRVGRLLLPLVFWSLALPLMYYIYFAVAGATSSPSVDMSAFTGQMTLKKMATFVFNFNYDTTPLWYLYMLIGIYFIMPVVSAWLQQASRRDIKHLLYVWGFTLLLPYVRMVAPALGYMGNYGNMGLWGECDWNAYGTFYYVSGFLGYIVLAHYLVRYPLQWSRRKLLAVGVPMFLAGYAITFVGYLVMNEYYPGNYAYLEILWLFTGINVFMMTFPVFVAVQRINIAPNALLSRMASLTFGIYLCHFVFVQMGYDLYASLLPAATPMTVRILLCAVTAFLVSAGVVWLFSLNRFTSRFVE